MIRQVARNVAKLSRGRVGYQKNIQHAFYSAEPQETEKPIVLTEKDLSPKVEKVLNEILQLSMLEVAELAHAIQEKLGLPDISLASVGSGDSGSAPAEVEQKVEKTEFDVKLASFDAKSKIKVIKEVRALTGLGLKEAKELVESTPATLKTSLKKEEAEEIIAKLKEVGGVCEME